MTKADKYLIAFVIVLIIIGLYLYYKTDFFKNIINQVSNDEITDSITKNNINKLHPKVREKAKQFIIQAGKQGVPLRITQSFRTYEEQNKLYAQGRTEPGIIVTNAKGGYSNHNFAMAFDVVPLINGKAEYDVDYWNEIGQLGKSFGFEWGGDWINFKDRPHFEMTFGYSLAQLRKLYESGNTENGYVNIV